MIRSVYRRIHHLDPAVVLALTLTLLAACSGPTGPTGLDPTVLVINNMPVGTQPDTVVLAWWDQSGQTAIVHVAPGASQCVHFTSTTPADSVRFVVVVGDTLDPIAQSAKSWSPWFDPQTGLVPGPGYPNGAEYWRLTAMLSPNGNFLLSMVPVAQAPC
jgi:hypothetical protein